MATIKKFEALEVWQIARVLCNEIYPLTLENSFARDFKLRDQINGSSGSVMDNIAEGFDRDGTKEFKQFLSISKASCGEVRSQLYRALDRGHISSEQQIQLNKRFDDLAIKIGNFMDYLKNTEFTGKKYKVN